MCEKVIYDSRDEANEALLGINRRKKEVLGEREQKSPLTYSYYCNECEGWHLTSKDDKAKRMEYIYKGKYISKKSVKNMAKHNRL